MFNQSRRNFLSFSLRPLLCLLIDFIATSEVHFTLSQFEPIRLDCRRSVHRLVFSMENPFHLAMGIELLWRGSIFTVRSSREQEQEQEQLTRSWKEVSSIHIERFGGNCGEY
ncbi:unnamed protein product [Lactuca virosa]|uniref:Secreted protein n=1 Tax=Lactuca virosa TaxID=75947 RepID=A0AAU9LH62_9ASTR|nr:unnamed protein product [Lactuca virosa]